MVGDVWAKNASFPHSRTVMNCFLALTRGRLALQFVPRYMFLFLDWGIPPALCSLTTQRWFLSQANGLDNMWHFTHVGPTSSLLFRYLVKRMTQTTFWQFNILKTCFFPLLTSGYAVTVNVCNLSLDVLMPKLEPFPYLRRLSDFRKYLIDLVMFIYHGT